MHPRARAAGRGGVRVSDLVRELGVSDMTIRRDLEVLGRARAAATRCTAVRPRVGPARTDEPGFAAKSARQRQREGRPSRAAPPSSSSPGTRGRALGRHDDLGARAPPDRRPGAHRRHQLDPGRRRLLPPPAARPDGRAHRRRPHALRRAGRPGRGGRDRARCNVDLLFLGVHGMSARAGFTTPNLMEAETNRALVRRRRAGSSSWPTTPSGARSGSRTIARAAATPTCSSPTRALRRGPRRAARRAASAS